MDNFSPSKGLLDLTRVILMRTFSEDKLEKLTDKQVEYFSNTVHRHLVELKSRQHLILTKRFGIDDGVAKTYQAIRDDFGVTRERIRQIVQVAIYRLQRKAQSDLCLTMCDIEVNCKERGCTNTNQ